jgi:putative acetyltransferase
MHELEAHLLSNGTDTARLETGIRQPEAIALYRKLGYVERGPYGAYVTDPLSLFMEKKLERDAWSPAS